MYPSVKAVKPLADYKLQLLFDDGTRRVFDVTPWLTKGAFRELRKDELFRTARISFDTVEWANGCDLCPEVLYAESVPINAMAARSPAAGQTMAVAEAKAAYQTSGKPRKVHP